MERNGLLATLATWMTLATVASTTGTTSSTTGGVGTTATNPHQYIRETFTDASNNGNFTHLVTDDRTGKLYLGAVNRLYALSEDLNAEKVVSTGPKMDTPNCPPPPLDCTCTTTSNCDDYQRRSRNSINKALVIDKVNQRLIACFNLFQGRCEKRHLDDISQHDPLLAISLVPNDDTSPVVIFIAPGPAKIVHNEVLYIGATRSNVGLNAYKDLVPTVSSRNLSNFEIAYSDVQSATKKQLEYQQRDLFKVYYIHGFSSGGFSYFLTVQRQSLEVGTMVNWVTKVVRVCQHDQMYYSYAEVPLQCEHEGANYNILRAAYVTRTGSNLARSLGLSDQPPITDNDDVLFALFSKSQYQSKSPTNDSVFCIYPLKNIRRVFTEIIQDCFNGLGNTGPPHIVPTEQCVKTSFSIDDNYCGIHDFNNPIAGTKPVQASAILRMNQTSVTSIAVMATHQYTIAFIGTNDGFMKKVVIESETQAKEYETVPIDPGSPVNKDMAFDRSKEHVYVMTSKKVSKVKVQSCSQYSTCGDCLGAKDPFCGWCVLEKKCGKQTECRDYDQGRRWLPYSGTQCTRIKNVIPDQVQIKDSGVSRLTLSIQNLPSLIEGGYECAFSGFNIVRTTTARIGDQRNDTTFLMCESPYPNLLPPIPTGKDHIVMQLSVRMNTVDFVTKNFTFFDCALHSACTSCTMSDYPCTWCVRGHRCTSNQETCLSDDLITGKAVKGASDSPGPDHCPKFESSFTEILVPSGSDHKVNVKALNLQNYQSDFKCRFNIEGQTQEVSAFRPQGTNVIECNTVNFLYQAQTAHLNVPFQIFWGKRKPLDNPDRIQVVVYKCQKMADNCGECLTVSHKYNCGWCSNACTIQNQCKHRNWRNSSMDCPNPKILSFTPTSGPREGGTRVTIEGENLGKLFDDIKAGVQVAEEPCEPDKNAYVPALRIVCVTGRSSEVKTDKVRVVIRNTYTAEAEQDFSYVEPYISDFFPIRGPQSGGTRLTIIGDHMNTGTNTTATVAGLPCQIVPTSITDYRMVCQTSPNPDLSPASGAVSVKFDNALVIHKEKVFSYVRDPNITGVTPHKTIMSGGIRLTVTGTNLQAVQSPKMYISVNNQQFTNDCTVKNDSWMLCRTPNIANANLRPLKPQESLSVPFGFHMDNVKELLNYTHAESEQLLVYEDPVFSPFKDGTKRVQPKEDEHLTITGAFLAQAMTTSDVTVKVGAAECKVTSLSQSYLICTPPGPDEEGVGTNPKVTVHVGSNFNYTVGKLKYESMEILSLPTIIGIGAGGGILILIIIIVCIAYRQKSRESDRVMKRMQNQMDVLEARVAKECKEAFAELQTDMSELTSDLSGPVGIPFRDYRSFCMHVLFPLIGEVDHPVIRPLEVDLARRDGIERGLRLFNGLVLNKTFLLLFIRTLESHKNFSMRERVNVASLISVALQGRMEHHTDILKTLLADLIERSMEDRGHPKLLLRRTESVAEKMLTNWFTFLLYKFLKECAGEPLFMLYRAIKQQVDKGPVDVFTGEAKYSLSEDKLIRQQIDYRVLMIHVIDPDVQYGSQEHAVKVLDCDTIAQVKEKILDAIYKNAPHSTRPDKDDLDLEWRTGVKGRLILQDEDVTSKTEGDFKRINTLSHYKVSDMALMALIPKQSSMYNLSFGSDRSGSHHRFDTYMTGSPSLTRPLAPHTIQLEMENGAKYYHLVKSHDSEMQKEGDRGSKMVSEIYLTRLLATKGTLQQFVDDLFETIFSTANRGSALPLAIKYMFDFLDDQALHHGISDPEVVHTWKSNSLPLRFWVNVVKNPDFVFDIHKSNIVDSCLSVVAQTFMDSCSMSEHRLGKDSPSSKLLYAKDIPKYKRWVERYYQDIKLMPAISEQDMNAMLAEESRLHQNEFNINAALYELYQYVARYNDELMDALTEDEFARNYRLSQKLEQVHNCMDSYA